MLEIKTISLVGYDNYVEKWSNADGICRPKVRFYPTVQHSGLKFLNPILRILQTFKKNLDFLYP